MPPALFCVKVKTNTFILGVKVADNVEYYDFEQDKWFMTDPLLAAKSGIATIYIERHLFDENIQKKYSNKRNGMTSVQSNTLANEDSFDSNSSVTTTTSIDSSSSSSFLEFDSNGEDDVAEDMN